MNELAFARDYTALLTEAPQLQAALSAKITERDSLVLWNAKPKDRLFFLHRDLCVQGFCVILPPTEDQAQNRAGSRVSEP